MCIKLVLDKDLPLFFLLFILNQVLIHRFTEAILGLPCFHRFEIKETKNASPAEPNPMLNRVPPCGRKRGR
jgi:hypothetical protein